MTYSDFVLSGGKMMTVGVSTGAHALSTYALSSSSGTPVWTEEDVEKGARTAQSGCAGPGSGINTLSSVRTFLAHETEVFEEFSLYLYTENNKMDFPVNCWKFENELDIR